MKNISSNIYVHPITIIISLITLLTGHFKMFILYTFIICIHELGHILSALFFKWNISRVIILPFGGITVFNELINKPLKEEFIIAVSGPIFQILVFVFFKDYFNVDYAYYNAYILIFNLLPIYPLDGYKILNIIINKFIPFNKTNVITLIISLFLTYIFILIFFIKFDIIFIIIFLFLLIGIIKEKYKLKYIYNKFLYERYIGNIKYKKRKTVSSLNNLFKDCTHIIKVNGSYITEKEALNNKYNYK